MSDACYCDYESPRVFHDETRKAVRPHKCGECGRRIQTGETYEHVWGVWDGVSSHHKTCLHCRGFREYVRAHVPCFCWLYGTMREDALQVLRDYAHEIPGLWFSGARRYVQAEQLRRQQTCPA